MSEPIDAGGAVAPPPEHRRTLRVGIMGNGRRFPAWQAEALRALAEIPQVELALLIVRGDATPRRSRLAVLRDRRHLLWTLFNKGYIERRSQASRSTDMTVELASVPELRCRTHPVGRYRERFDDADMAVIADHRLDVILRFGFGILTGDILSCARYGVWSFHHGDERRFRGQPPAFWEMMEGEPVVGVILQRLTERLDGGTVLHRGCLKVTGHSYRRTRDDAFFGGSDFPSIVVRQILNDDTAAVSAAPSVTDAPVRRSPTNLAMLRFLARQAAAFVTSQVSGVARSAKWSVGIADTPIWSLLAEPLPAVTWMAEQGRSRYLADPFPDPTGRSDMVLVEDYDYDTHRGVISAVDMTGNERPRTVLDAGVHALYPYLFHHDGAIYCMPETYQAEQVRLYRAVSFPDRWELVATPLTGIRALDPTAIQFEDRWWLFCSLEGAYRNIKLHVFHAAEPCGPWLPHALNPVKTDVRSSRPAGTPFIHDGHLYRPSQDGSVSYGGGVTINRIDELTPQRFAETTVARIAPPDTGPYRQGIHTISAHGDRTVVDGRRDLLIPAGFRREMSGRLRRLLPGR
ncbi:MAG: hypothetical protein M3349_00795 [Actinomycetota bacterium]|nr:hypothetical protein [Actinomycetota bacterium]